MAREEIELSPMLSPRQIRRRILIPVIASFLLLGAIFFSTFVNSLKNAITAEFDSKAVALARSLATQYENSLQEKDPSAVQAVLDDYRKIRGVEFIYVLRENGEMLAHTFVPEVPVEVLAGENFARLESDVVRKSIRYQGSDILEIEAPILSGLAGSIHIGMNISSEFQRVAQDDIIRGSIVTLLVIILGTMFLYYAINRIATTLQLTNTELSLANQELKRTQETLTTSSKMTALGEMAGGIAHEINTPLSVIQLSGDELKDLATKKILKTSDIFLAVNRIDKMVTRISNIIKGLRNFSRDAGSDPFSVVLVKDVLSETMILCEARLKFEGVEVRIVGDLHQEIECRPVQISQILINLLNNSLDAVRAFEKKWIEISITDRGDFVGIRITDCGTGIPKDVAAKIMQPFFTTKAVGKGTGLGLSISVGLVRANGGNLVLDSDSPNTSFVLTLLKRQNS